MSRIYLDHNATTRPHPRVAAAMQRALDETFGNPSSVHADGRAARDLVEAARAEIALLVGAKPESIVFTSGGTEGDNLAIRGAALAMRSAKGRDRVLSSPLEHPAVLESLSSLRAAGFRIDLVPVDGEGRIDPSDLRSRLDADVALCTFSLANHELGNLYPVAELSRLAHAAGALFHCDAVQAAGKVTLDVTALGVDLLTLSAHKIYGPKGIGAIYVGPLGEARGIEPLLVGGGQEKRRRPGTENVPGTVGFGVAATLARTEGPRWCVEVARLRDRLEEGALRLGARRFGAAARVAGTANLGFSGVEAELLMINLDLAGIAISTGAACSSGSIEPSPVVMALGVSKREAAEAARFSLGRENTEAEVDEVLERLPEIVARVRRSAAHG